MIKIVNIGECYIENKMGKWVIRNLNFEISPNKFVSIVGRWGSGKTTLLKIIGGLLAPTEGQVKIMGKDIYTMEPKKMAEYRCNTIGFVFQDYKELDPTTRWSDRLQSGSGEWSGNVCDFYFRVYNKIIKDVKVPFKMSGGERIDDTPVHKALREALANCLINADYHGLRGVVIRKESDKLILANPGYIRTGKKQMRLGGESDPRNKALVKMFNLINIGERAGSGVPNIFNVWADEGWEEPVIEERFDPDRTILSLPFVKKVAEKKWRKKSGEKNTGKIRCYFECYAA